MLQNTQLENILTRLGLHESDIQVYFASLKQGPSTVIQLAKEANLKRLTTHAIVEKLLQKEIFLETKNKQKRLVYPNSVDSLHRLLEKQKSEVKQLENDMANLKSILQNLQASSQGFAHVRFYKGKEGVQLMINEIINDKKDMYIVSDSRHFYDLIDNEFLEKSLEVRQKHKLQVQMIFPLGFEYFAYTQGSYKQKLEVKSLPEKHLLRGGLNIRGDKVGFHCEENDFITTTIIEDKAIAQIMIYMFRNLREIAKEY